MFLINCNTDISNKNLNKSKNTFTDLNIKGEWLSTDSINNWMPRLVFQDSTVTLFAKGDSIANMKYVIKGGKICYSDYENKFVASDSITHYEDKRLILNSILSNKGNFVYIKVK